MRAWSAMRRVAPGRLVAGASVLWVALLVVLLSSTLWLTGGSVEGRALTERDRLPLVLDNVLMGAVGLAGLWVAYGLLRGSHAALAASEETHRQLVEGLPDIVMRFDREARHLYVSANVTRVVDMAPAQFLGKTHRELGFPEALCALWEDAVRKVVESGAPYETEFAFEGKAGPTVFDWRLAPERDVQGQVRSVLSISRDVTAQRQAEQSYSMLFREMLDGFALHEIVCDERGTPVDYRFLAVNPAFERLTGLKAADVVGKTVLQVLPGTERRWIGIYGRVALTGEPAYFEDYAAALGRTCEVRAFRPAPGQFATVFADITARKRTEDDLREGQARFHAIFDHAPVALWEEDFSAIKTRFDELRAAGVTGFRAYLGGHPEEVAALAALVRVRQVNLHSAEVLGAISVEQVTRDLPSYFTPASLPAFQDEMVALAEGQTRFRAEIPILNSLGEPTLLDLVLSVQPPYQDTLERVLVSFVDITAHRQAEEALRASEERYRGLFEHMSEGYAYCEMLFEAGQAYDWIYLAVNDAFETLTGLRDVAGRRVSEVIPGIRESDPELFAAYARVSLTGQPEKFEMLVKSLDIWFSVSVYSPQRGFFVAVFGVITERKRAEQALRASEAKYRKLFSEMVNGFALHEIVCDERGNAVDYVTLEVNAAYESFLDVPRELVLGKRASEILPPDELAHWLGIFGPVALTGQSARYEMFSPLNHKHFAGAAYSPEQGQFAVTFADITGRKQAEEALSESEARFRALYESSADAILLTTLDGSVLAANPAACRLWGRSESEIRQVGRDGLVDATDPRLTMALEERRRTGRTRTELTLRRRDGALFPGEVTSVVFQGEGGRQLTSMIVRDVSARKQAEEALRDSEERYRTITEQMSDMVFVTDMQGTVTYVSSASEPIFGFRPPEMEGRPLTDFLAESDIPRAVAAFRHAISTGTHAHGLELAMKRQDGSLFTGELASNVYRKGGIAGTLGVVRDISARKRGERERETTVELLRLVNERQGTRELVQAVVTFFQQESGCEAVGVRLREDEDYPYYEVRGFPPAFVQLENNLCARDAAGDLVRDCVGNPLIECMCGNVICGRFDPTKPFFTAQGSFWTNGTTALLASTTEVDRQARTRNRCNGEGYESVALVPLRVGNESLGLLQLNDRRPGMFTAETIALWERLAGYLAVALSKLRAEEALHESERNLREFVNAIPERAVLVDARKRILLVNESVPPQRGTSADALVGTEAYQYASAELAADRRAHLDEAFRTAQPVRFEDSASGQHFVHYITPILDATGHVSKAAIIVFDITERRRGEEEREKLQAQLMQPQKMESVGRLAGGVAHDFNNMLGVILGHAELAMQEVDSTQPLHADLEEIRKAAQRSADLTRQLLAFARRQTAAPQVLDLNDTVAGMLRMLQRLIGEDISLVWRPGAELWSVRIDPSQVDQILANLCVNARDAIAGVGKVTIETHNVALDAVTAARQADSAPGDYVLLAVSDTGSGMGPEVLGHLFEPFFTTKGVGQGTGLGLATVYGIVRQNLGFIEVQSTVGQGSTFRIYLPRCVTPTVDVATAAPKETPRGRGETVLVVEDEAAILRMGQVMLERLGYTVLTAHSPSEALRLAAAHPGEIHLLITDVVMPEMNGRDLAARLRAGRPGLKCVFMSGYTADVIARQGVLDEGVLFMQKPFSMQGLAAKVREALGEK